MFVKTAQDPSLGDAVNAELTAAAFATVDQEANQTNINSQSSVPASELDLESEVDQDNESEQEGTAIAFAEANDVTVVQDDGTLFAGEDGIDADFSAVAVAIVDQDVTQSNQNNVPYPSDLEQSNEAEQDGFALAVGAAGAVTIEQLGNIDAVLDGIKAKSSASAEAKVEQEASQENLINGVVNLDSYNDAYQSAAAAAVAVADKVSITTNGKIYAGDDGVVGVSVADADAEVSQTLVQAPSGLLPVGNPGVVDLAQLSHQYGLGHGEWSG